MAASSSPPAVLPPDSTLFICRFQIVNVDNHNRQNVSRIKAVSQLEEDRDKEEKKYEITVDIATKIYPLKCFDDVEILLASSFDQYSTGVDSGYSPNRSRDFRAKYYEYTMQGRVYKYVKKETKA